MPSPDLALARRMAAEANDLMPMTISVCFNTKPRAVMGRIAKLYIEAGRTSFTLDLRQLSGASGASPSTVSNTIREAERHGLLFVERQDRSYPVINIVDQKWKKFLENPEKGRLGDLKEHDKERSKDMAQG